MLHSNSFNNTQNKINALTRQVDACKQRRACAHTHAYTRTNSHTHSQAITYMHTSTRANTHVCARAQTYTATIYTLSHTCVCAHRNTHTHTHTLTQTHAHTHAYTRTWMQGQADLGESALAPPNCASWTSVLLVRFASGRGAGEGTWAAIGSGGCGGVSGLCSKSMGYS